MKGLILGKTYDVVHSRKGHFCFRVVADDGKWVTGEIISGRAINISRDIADNVSGEVITIRKNMASFDFVES